MLNNVKDFEAKGDGITDDREAIQAATDDAVSQGKGGILFPTGTYRVSRVTVAGGRWSLDLNGVQDFMVMGEGQNRSSTGGYHRPERNRRLACLHRTEQRPPGRIQRPRH